MSRNSFSAAELHSEARVAVLECLLCDFMSTFKTKFKLME